MKEILYESGKRIKDEWIIISILEVRNQNKKIICMHTKTGIFKEGWLWDFTNKPVYPTNNIDPWCYLARVRIKAEENELLDMHYEYSNDICSKTSYLSKAEYAILQGYREGIFEEIQHIIKKFDYLLSNNYSKHNQSRRNQRLAMLIATTYKLLYKKGRI
jgi:hypothetical protein